MTSLSTARYGKDNVRVAKVHRDPKTGEHSITEMTVCTLLSGDISTSYTAADNSVVVPTDTMKQTTYLMAKQHPVEPPEHFAAVLSGHFIATYPHISTARVTIVKKIWNRLEIEGKGHAHSFVQPGGETWNVEAVATRGSGSETKFDIKSSISGLLVLKTTGSAFHGFIQDEFTILKPTNDRFLSTSVDATWAWNAFEGLAGVGKAAHSGLFTKGYKTARDITIKTFAEDDSASVQATMYTMAGLILKAVPEVVSVEYVLPNKHYFEIDLSWHKGLKNTGPDAEVYAPQSDPNGLIQCLVTRQ